MLKQEAVFDGASEGCASLECLSRRQFLDGASEGCASLECSKAGGSFWTVLQKGLQCSGRRHGGAISMVVIVGGYMFCSGRTHFPDGASKGCASLECSKAGGSFWMVLQKGVHRLSA